MNEQERGRVLIGIARNAIATTICGEDMPVAPQAWLNEPGATFVTLTQGGELRGCIGSLQAYRSLAEDVRENAIAAAFRDPRFEPLLRHEWAYTECDISLLSPASALACGDENEALAQLRPGVDGVILEYGRYRSTFLPQVWEQLPQPHEFMAHLKHKAGLPVAFWAQGIKVSRYTVTKWREADYAAVCE